MKIILLPGFSKHNKEWAENIKSEFKKSNLDLTTIEWVHWANGKSSFSFPTEEKKVMKVIGGEERVVVLAKSVGTRLAARMIKNETLKPEKLIFMGVPSTNKIYEESLALLNPRKIKVIQNSNDPYGNFEEMRKFIKKINPEIEVIEKPSKTHNYPYPELLINLVK